MNEKVKLGAGSYSTVHAEGDLAVKVVKYDDFASVTREFIILRSLNHPNIIKINKLSYLKEDVRIYMPRYDKNLASVHLTLDRIFAVARALFSATAYLHARGIIHCDIKPQNILLKDDQIAICDFGISVLSAEQYHTSTVQTCTYRAPEVDLHSARVQYSTAVDIWSIGCVLFELCAGKPFAEFDPEQDDSSWYASVAYCLPTDYDRGTRLRLLRATNFEYVYSCIRDRIPNNEKLFASKLPQLIARCLLPDHKKRMTAEYGLLALSIKPVSAKKITLPTISFDEMICCKNLDTKVISAAEKCLPMAEKIYVNYMQKTMDQRVECRYGAIYIASCLCSGSVGVVSALVAQIPRKTLYAAVANIMMKLGGSML